MPDATFKHENDEQQFINYIMSQKGLQDMIKPYNTSVGRLKTLSGIPYREIHHQLFDDGRWTYNMQNHTLLMMLYSCAGSDKYLDFAIGGILNELSQNPPHSDDPVQERIMQNQLLGYMTETLQRYAPYNEKVHALLNYADFAINANTSEVQKSSPGYTYGPSFEQKIAMEQNINRVAAEYTEFKQQLTENGWVFDDNDEELLRTLFILRDTDNNNIGREIFDNFRDKALNTKIYNVVDKDNMYKFIQDYLIETKLDQYETTADLRNYIEGVRNENKREVEAKAKRTAQVTDLHTIITEIGNTTQNRSKITMLRGYEETDASFYNTHFVNEVDYGKASGVFDQIFGKLFKEQKKVSGKFAGMSELDRVTSTFKIMKEGAKEPMDLKKAVKDRLIRAEKYLDENEEGILPEEKFARQAVNERNMTTLAKLYVLHEMMNKKTNIIYEPYWADAQFDRNEPVADYLDINHPRIVKISDLDADKVQHDKNILEYYGEDKGMLFEQHYNDYVMGALNGNQVIRLHENKQQVMGVPYNYVREELMDKGWNFAANPTDENYLIMLFNAYDPMSNHYAQIEKCIGIMMETPVQNYYDRNNVLRTIYNELREHKKDSMMVESLCDYLLEDINRTKYPELRDQVIAAGMGVHADDVYKRINNMDVIEMTQRMNQNGWELDVRLNTLVNKIYNAYDENYPSANALRDIHNALTNLPANITVDEMINLYNWMSTTLKPYNRNDEFAEELDNYIFLLGREAAAQKEAEAGATEAGSVATGQYFRKNFSEKKVTTEENNEIQNVNGFAVTMNEDIKEEDFKYMDPHEDFFKKEGAPKRVYKNDGVENQREEQDIDFMTPENKRYAVAYNKFKYTKLGIFGELCLAAEKLQQTAKQKGKKLGEDGTGSPSYKNMALALADCLEILGNPDANPKDIVNTLKAFEKASEEYKKEHTSVFGKRGDGKKRLDVSEKWSGPRMSEVIITFKNVLKEVREAAKENREEIKLSEMSDKKVAFTGGKIFYSTDENMFARMSRDELEKEFRQQNAVAKQQAAVIEKLYALTDGRLDKTTFEEKNLKGVTKEQFAADCVAKQYFQMAMKDGIEAKELQEIIENIDNNFSKEVTQLNKSKVFDKLVKKNPKNYFKIWNNVQKAGKDLEFTSSEFLEGIKEMFGVYSQDGQLDAAEAYVEYIIPGKGDKNSKNRKIEDADSSYRKLAQIVSSQIVARNPEFAKGVAVEAVQREVTAHDVMNELREKIEKYLKETKVLESKGFSSEKLGRELEDGSFTRKTMVNIERQQEAAKVTKTTPKKDKTANRNPKL